MLASGYFSVVKIKKYHTHHEQSFVRAQKYITDEINTQSKYIIWHTDVETAHLEYASRIYLEKIILVVITCLESSHWETV